MGVKPVVRDQELGVRGKLEMTWIRVKESKVKLHTN